MSHNSCNMGTRGLPDMYTLRPPLYVSVKPLVHMLQLLNIASSPAFDIPYTQKFLRYVIFTVFADDQ